MQIKWKTLAVYACIAIGVSLVYHYGHHYTAPSPVVHQKPPAPEPVTTTETDPPTIHCKCKCPPKGECLCTCVEQAKPVPPTPPVVTKPPKKPFVKKPRNLSPQCQLVPQAAYDAPPDVVIEAARRRGLPEIEIAILKWCIGAR